MAARLFEPVTIRGLTLKNRVVISPMCQYSAEEGYASDWHLVHLGRFALGGAALVMVEATAVTREGRITHGDTGIWSDSHIEPLARVASFLKTHGAAAGLQLAHAGRKASMQRPWYGNGPLNAEDAARGEDPWRVVAPSPIPLDDGWLMPSELTLGDIRDIKAAFVSAAERGLRAGFDVVELHCAHGYLMHSFLSPLSNKRNDDYGGSRDKRMRLPFEMAEAVRAFWPKERPVFVRVSSVDMVEGGVAIEDTIAFAKGLKAVGIDVVDCSSGGIMGSATAAKMKRSFGFQVPYAERIRKEAGIMTMAVGLIVDPQFANTIIAEGRADLVAIGREALKNPNWPLHAEAVLEDLPRDQRFAAWPHQAGWWLERRQRELDRLNAENAA